MVIGCADSRTDDKVVSMAGDGKWMRRSFPGGPEVCRRREGNLVASSKSVSAACLGTVAHTHTHSTERGKLLFAQAQRQLGLFCRPLLINRKQNPLSKMSDNNTNPLQNKQKSSSQ